MRRSERKRTTKILDQEEEEKPIVKETVKRRRTARSSTGKDTKEVVEVVIDRPKRRSSVKQGGAGKAEIRQKSDFASGSDSKGRGEDVSEIKIKLEELLRGGDRKELDDYIEVLKEDSRDSVLTLVKKTKQSIMEEDQEMNRLKVMMKYEMAALTQEEARLKSGPKGFDEEEIAKYMQESFFMVGVDEVGVGPLAGPIVSCAIAFRFPLSLQVLHFLAGINDSKKLNMAKRRTLADIIKAHCFTFSLGIVEASLVDTLNPLQGSIEAMRRAVTSLDLPNGSSFHVLVDHHHITGLSSQVQQTSITKGDSKSICIAAASIVAKVWRDDYMIRLHEQYPEFGFDRNAGYGTAIHLAQLKKGITCPEHRFSFEPVRQAQRKANGLPPDNPVKKPRKATTTKKGQLMAEAVESATNTSKQTPSTEAVLTTPAPSILSLTYWTNWLLPAAST